MAGDKAVGIVTNSMHDVSLSRASVIEHARLLLEQVQKHPDLDYILQVHSIARVLGTGKNFTVKVEKLDLSISDAAEKPSS